MRKETYWETPFMPLCDSKELVEFYVIDVQLENQRVGKRALATIEVAKSNDLSRTFFTRSHLGYILNPGDHAVGYDLSVANFNSDNWEILASGRRQGTIPDVILVRKSYPHARKKSRKRNWKLKGLVKEEEADTMRTKAEKAKAEQDYELFLRDIEEDPELRAMMNLYKGLFIFFVHHL
jgi:nonsense-mediated mRNA decay protein 3